MGWADFNMFALILRLESQLPEKNDRGMRLEWEAGCVQTEAAAGGGQAGRVHNGQEPADQY